jgi:hypothetical protein
VLSNRFAAVPGASVAVDFDPCGDGFAEGCDAGSTTTFGFVTGAWLVISFVVCCAAGVVVTGGGMVMVVMVAKGGLTGGSMVMVVIVAVDTLVLVTVAVVSVLEVNVFVRVWVSVTVTVVDVNQPSESA